MMNKLLLSLFLASMTLVAGAQDFADQKEKSENLVGEESRMSFQTDTTQSLFALSKLTGIIKHCLYYLRRQYVIQP